jgi:hypothetical protein
MEQEFKNGDMVEVKGCDTNWVPRRFIGYTSNGKPVAECEESGIYVYNHCRKPKQTVDEFTINWYIKYVGCNSNRMLLQYYNDRKAWEDSQPYR